MRKLSPTIFKLAHFHSFYNIEPAKIRINCLLHSLQTPITPQMMENTDMVPLEEKGQLSGNENDTFPLPVCSRVSPLRNHMEECGLRSSMPQGKKMFSLANLFNSIFCTEISSSIWLSGSLSQSVLFNWWSMTLLRTSLERKRETFCRIPTNDISLASCPLPKEAHVLCELES